MPKAIELKKGERFGKWTVIEASETRTKKGERQWSCRCDCGTVGDLTVHKLRSGHSKSCGCGRAVTDIVGQRFGKWTVIKKAKLGSWFCRCDCGATKLVPNYILKNGATKSCGCHRRSGLVINGRRLNPRKLAALCGMSVSTIVERLGRFGRNPNIKDILGPVRKTGPPRRHQG